MKRNNNPNFAVRAVATAAALGSVLIALPLGGAAHAQDAPFASGSSGSLEPLAEPTLPAAQTSSSPIRLARFSYVRGDVTWRSASPISGVDAPLAADDADASEPNVPASTRWTNAALNMPLQQGAQIWVSDNSRAELQFDDGSRLRFNANTLVTLRTLFSDPQGEFTEIVLSSGEAYFRLTQQSSEYQISGPLGSVRASGPARFGVGTGDGLLRVGVRLGTATVEGLSAVNSVRLNAQEFVRLASPNAHPVVQRLASPTTEWEKWNANRDRELDGFGQSATRRNVPVTLSLWGDDLDYYGTWRTDPNYGAVWVPTVSEAGWRPYYHGQWTWVEPWGWTWVGAEPWGWTPYHYGTWFHAAYGWGWRPGPATQFWSPAVVSFYHSGNNLAWCPLAPHEVYYPAVFPQAGFGYGGGLSYAVSSASVYCPNERTGVYEPRIWQASYDNYDRRNIASDRTPRFRRPGTVPIPLPTYYRLGLIPPRPRTPVHHGGSGPFVPTNARNGGTVVPASQFGQAAAAHFAASPVFFRNGEVVDAPLLRRPASTQAGTGQMGPRGTAFRAAPPLSVPSPPLSASPTGLMPSFRQERARALAPAPSAAPFVPPIVIRSTAQRFPAQTGRTQETPRPFAPPAPAPSSPVVPSASSPRLSGLDNYLRERNRTNSSNGGERSGGGRTPAAAPETGYQRTYPPRTFSLHENSGGISSGNQWQNTPQSTQQQPQPTQTLTVRRPRLDDSANRNYSVAAPRTPTTNPNNYAVNRPSSSTLSQVIGGSNGSGGSGNSNRPSGTPSRYERDESRERAERASHTPSTPAPKATPAPSTSSSTSSDTKKEEEHDRHHKP